MKPKVLSLPFFVLSAFLYSSAVSPSAVLEKQSSKAYPEVKIPYGQLPLSFEVNRGQTDSDVKFLSRGNGYTLFLSQTDAILTFGKTSGNTRRWSLLKRYRTAASTPERGTIRTLRMRVIGANSLAKISGMEMLPGKSNYFIGNDPAKWLKDIPHYAKVRVENVYPGIDLLYYGNQRRLEYDWVLGPGADASVILFSVEGGGQPKINTLGNLILDDSSKMMLEQPTIYQEQGDIRTEISGKYVLKSDGQIGFQLGKYDSSLPLIIDPVLSYSTFLGGEDSDDGGIGIAVDSAGSAIVTGNTLSIDFPVTPGVLRPSYAKYTETFVAKLNAKGNALLFSTYLGGSGTDEASGISVDESGNIYITGKTNSTDLPTTQGAFQRSYSGIALDVFVAKINPAGNALLFSTYIGSGGYEATSSICLDREGNSFITGTTYSQTFPTTSGAFQRTIKGSDEIFVAKLNPSGSALIYSTFIGGRGSDQGARIKVDSAGNVLLTGSTSSSDFPVTTGSFQTLKGLGDTEDAFVTKLNSDGSRLLYASYLGGSGADGAFDIEVDPYGSAYVCGVTLSPDFPVTPGAFQTKLVGSEDGFIAKIDATGTQLRYSTFLNGGDMTVALAIAVNSFGHAYVSGMTSSTRYPLTPGALQRYIKGPVDIFVTQFNAEGSALSYSTVLGGKYTEYCNDMFLDNKENVYLTGQTDSTDFPTVGALQGLFAGATDAFVLKLAMLSPGLEMTVPGGGAATASTSGTGDLVRTGYTKVMAGSAANPYGVAVFSYKQGEVTVAEAGVPATRPTKAARIFIDYRTGVNAVPARVSSGIVDINTGIAVVNHGAQIATVTYELRDQGGRTLTVGKGSLDPGRHIACFINGLKNNGVPDFDLPSDFQTRIQFGTLDVTADQPLSVLALRGTVNQREEFLITTTPVADLGWWPDDNPIYFPQFVDGGGYTTSIILLNSFHEREMGKLEIRDKDGNPLTITLANGTTDYAFRYSIEPGGVFRLQTDGSTDITNAGWVQVIPDAGTHSPVGSGVFGYNPADVLLSESGIPSATATTHARIFVDLSGNHNTGLAIANTSGSSSNLTFAAFEKDGVTEVGVGKKPFPLNANCYTAAFADGFVTGLPKGFAGVLDISATLPFAALTLRSLTNENGDFLMTTFPVADSNQDAPAPIVFPHIANGGGYTMQFILLNPGGEATSILYAYDESGEIMDIW
jgi:hypothetical protein